MSVSSLFSNLNWSFFFFFCSTQCIVLMLWELKMLTIWSASLLMVKCAPGVLICSLSLRYVLTTVYCVWGGCRILEGWGGSSNALLSTIPCSGKSLKLRSSEMRITAFWGLVNEWLGGSTEPPRIFLDTPQCEFRKKGESLVYFNCQNVNFLCWRNY